MEVKDKIEVPGKSCNTRGSEFSERHFHLIYEVKIMCKKNNPVGLFDSGVGGLSVLKEIFRQLPYENTVYFADIFHRRYGTKSEKVIKKYVFEIINFLIKKKKAKIIIMACNTATSFALEDARKNFKIPIIGVIEPGAKMALKVTQNKAIGIIGTEVTIRKKMHRKIIETLDPKVRVFEQACPPFGNFVEQGLVNPEKIRETVNRYLKILKNKEIDTLILGCTHYPFLKDFIKETLGSDVRLIDPSQETVLEVKKILRQAESLNLDKQMPVYEFFTSGNKSNFKNIAGKLLGKELLKVEHICF